MTREEAIKHLHDDWFMSLGGQLCVDMDKKDGFCEALGVAITALRAQQESNTPLTLEELDGEPVVFPCKVGDLVYEVDEPEYGVITCRVLYIDYYTGPAGHVPGNPMVSTISIGVEVISGHGKGSSYCFEQEDIGKLVFLTRQEAESVILSCRHKPEEGTM